MPNEIKRIYFDSQSAPVANGDVEAGAYDLTFDSQTTSSLNYNDSAATIQAALEALSSIGSGNVAVGGMVDGYTVEFQGALADTNVGALTAGNITLKQKADTVSVATTTNGAAGVYEVHTISLGGATTGTFDLTNGFATPTVSSLDSAGIQAAYELMYGPGVTINDIGGGNFTATFPNQGEQSNPSVSSNSTDGSPSVTVYTEGVTPAYQVVTVTLPDTPTEGTLNVTLDGNTSSDFNYNDSSPASITGWTGGGSAGNWTYTRDTAAADVSASGAEGSTPLRKDCGLEIVTTQEGSAATSQARITALGAQVIGDYDDAGFARITTLGVQVLGEYDDAGFARITTVGVQVLGRNDLHELEATSVSSSTPTVGTPTLGVIYSLAASGVTSGTPTVDSPAIGQIHALTATGVSSGTPTVGSPAIGGDVALTANNVASGTPSVGSPTLGQIHALTANSVSSGTPSVGSPSIGQIHGLATGGVSSGTPSVGSPVFGQLHALVAMAVASGTPTVGSPVLVMDTRAIPSIVGAQSFSAGMRSAASYGAGVESAGSFSSGVQSASVFEAGITRTQSHSGGIARAESSQ